MVLNSSCIQISFPTTITVPLSTLKDIVYLEPYYSRLNLVTNKKTYTLNFKSQKDFIMFNIGVGFATKRFPVNSTIIKQIILKKRFTSIALR